MTASVPRARGRAAARRPERVRVDVALAGVRRVMAADVVRRTAVAVLRAERVRDAALSVTLVSDARMRRLNARHLGRRRLTDVIAFSLTSAGGPVTGDIYVAPGVAREAAGRFGVDVREELQRLVVHGVLHVLGYDHPEGERRVQSAMWRRQEELVRRLSRRR